MYGAWPPCLIETKDLSIFLSSRQSTISFVEEAAPQVAKILGTNLTF